MMMGIFFFAGFVPTFGPAFIHLYGSTRDYNFIDEHSNLNDGLGEGVSYRGRIMIALKTDISDSIDTAPSEVEVMATQTINEVCTYVQYSMVIFSSLLNNAPNLVIGCIIQKKYIISEVV